MLTMKINLVCLLPLGIPKCSISMLVKNMNVLSQVMSCLVDCYLLKYHVMLIVHWSTVNFQLSRVFLWGNYSIDLWTSTVSVFHSLRGVNCSIFNALWMSGYEQTLDISLCYVLSVKFVNFVCTLFFIGSGLEGKSTGLSSCKQNEHTHLIALLHNHSNNKKSSNLRGRNFAQTTRYKYRTKNKNWNTSKEWLPSSSNRAL